MEPFLTILKFFFITDSNTINLKELKFLFGSEGENEEHELNEENNITLHPKYPKSCVYYFETITVKYKKIEIFNFQFLVYINKNNNIIIDLDEKDGPSFELLFYAKSSKFMPACLNYKNKQYNQLESYGNKYRSRIFFVNVDPTKLQYINSKTMNKYEFNFQKNNTYQVLFRIYELNQFEISMTNMYSYFENDMIFLQPKKKLEEKGFKELEKMLIDFYEKYDIYMTVNPVSIEQKKIYYSILKENAYKIYNNDLYEFMDSPENFEFEKLTEKVLNLFHIDFFLNEFIKLAEEDVFEKDKYEIIELRISEYHKMEENLYNKLKNDHNLDIQQKVKILKTLTIFCKNCLVIPGKLLGMNYINIKNIAEESPYFKSIEMLKNIISEITEESRLFEAFMYFDSEIIHNILEKNTQKEYKYVNIFGQEVEVKQPEYITEYGMSLMTVEEIKKHLLDLLPTIIVQIDSNINLRALFENKTKVMTVNEYQMFGNFIDKNENIFKEEPDCYVVPISMEILHEILGHSKIRYNKEFDSSPLVLRDSKNNFKSQKLMRKIKLDFNKEITINKGETGRVLEYYISDDKNLIQTLKKKSYNKKIIDSKYWVGENFNALYDELDFHNESQNISKFQGEINLDENDNEENYDCMFYH